MPQDTDAKLIQKWATNGDVATPENEGLTRAAGWPASYSPPGTNAPTREGHNQLFREITGALVEVFQKGVLGWDTSVSYYHPAMTLGSDGKAYISVRDSQGIDPVQDTDRIDWTPLALIADTNSLLLGSDADAVAGTRTDVAVHPAGLGARTTQVYDERYRLQSSVIVEWPADALRRSGSTAAKGPVPSAVVGGAAYEYQFDDAASQQVYGYFTAPSDFAGSSPLVARLYWSAAATTGAVRWSVGVRASGNGEAMTGTYTGSQVTITVQTTTNRQNVTTITISSPGIAANDYLCLQIERVAANAGDTLIGDARLHFVSIEIG